MYVPATTQPPAAAASLAPAEIAGGTSPSGASLFASPPGTTASAHISVRLRGLDLNVLAGHAASVAGSLRSRSESAGELAGLVVRLQALTPRGWRTLASDATGRRGGFRVRYTPSRIGSRLVRLAVADATGERAAQRLLGRLEVYRLAGASWYGGGGTLACGGELTSSTLGVASKTLPCGTEVTLRYDGRTVTVPVIDRGPYVAGREFDLTEATKRALGFGSTGDVWSTR
jgi:rare lipoprotein A